MIRITRHTKVVHGFDSNFSLSASYSFPFSAAATEMVPENDLPFSPLYSIERTLSPLAHHLPPRFIEILCNTFVLSLAPFVASP